MLPKKILILRFSAMGDVMLLVPVLRSFTLAYPDVQITVVTRPRFATFFSNIPGVKIFEADVDYVYNGILGMRDLFRALMRKGSFDLVIDMHDHIRTMMLRGMYKLFGTPVIVFDKGKKDKKAFTRRENKVTNALPHTVERYHEALQKAGFTFQITTAPYLFPDEEAKTFVDQWLEQKNLNKKEQWIGIAPFAMHTSKVWPTDYYPVLIEKLIAARPVKLFLFGGGVNEIKFFESLVEKFPEQCVIVAGQMKIRHEIALLQHLDLMVCVDSSNMHLAALTGIPLLAIWGGTHPDVGFSPYGGKADILQISRDELPCRPCSVYGKETCFRADFACLNRITPDQVLAEILKQ